MSKTLPITRFGYQLLTRKREELNTLLKRPGRRSREMEMAFRIYRDQLEEVDELLAKSVVAESSEKEPASVKLGSKVVLENLRNGDRQEYTIMSRSTANPLKGIISHESPLAQKMMGLKLGNTFKFRDSGGREESFKLKSIE